MTRLPRLDLPGIPQHIVQRGNNRLPCFLDDEDRARYRQLLREAGEDEPSQADLHPVGTASQIHKMFKLPDGIRKKPSRRA